MQDQPVSDELPYRIVLIAGVAVIMPVGMVYRVRAHRAGGPVDRRAEGWFILLTLRPVALAGMAGFFAYLIDPAWMAWSQLPLPAWLRWSGAGFGLAGGTLLIAALHHLGKNLTDTVVARESATLVTTGPYRRLRHPFYTATALAVLANSLMTANAFIAATSATAFGLIVLRTTKEEQHLVMRFGDDYREYMRRTARFVPGIW